MLDPNIFSKYKTKQDFDLEREEFEFRKRQRQMQEQIGGLQIMTAQKALMSPSQERLDMEQLLAKSIELGGVENLTPQEQAQLQAFDIAQRTKQSVDPRGNIITNRSVFDLMNMRPREAMNMPVRQAMVTQQPDMYGGYEQQMLDQYAPPQPMPVGQEQPSPVNIDQLFVDPSQFGVTSPYGQEDIRKAAAQEAIKAQGRRLQSEEEKAQLNLENQQSLQILNKMLELNKGTLDIPYAGYAQIGTRLLDQEAASNMARLRQLRLNLAAPLAKQLGVNPTDKDFENTLNQIFNENESKQTREEQIKLLMQVTDGKINPGGVSGLNAMLNSVGAGVPTKRLKGPIDNDPLGLFQ